MNTYLAKINQIFTLKRLQETLLKSSYLSLVLVCIISPFISGSLYKQIAICLFFVYGLLISYRISCEIKDQNNLCLKIIVFFFTFIGLRTILAILSNAIGFLPVAISMVLVTILLILNEILSRLGVKALDITKLFSKSKNQSDS